MAEIGANVLTHGRPVATTPVEYVLQLDHDTARASLIDGGPPVDDFLTRPMPDPRSEAAVAFRWLAGSS